MNWDFMLDPPDSMFEDQPAEEHSNSCGCQECDPPDPHDYAAERDERAAEIEPTYEGEF